jgi:hypothetical protein
MTIDAAAAGCRLSISILSPGVDTNRGGGKIEDSARIRQNL